MSDPVAEPAEPKQEASSPSQKRKRVVGDSPGERRSKRTAGTAAASESSIDHQFLESTAAAAANVDLSALQQANEAASRAEAAEAADVSSTAAAALDSMYPSMPATTSQPYSAGTHATAGQDASQDASAGFSDVNHVTQAEPAAPATTTLPPVPAPNMVANGTPQAAPEPPVQAPAQAPVQAPVQAQQVPVQPQTPQYSNPNNSNNFRPPKPAVGSEEWHKMRKNSHKEVERRRRETINEGINELAKIVPNCEKNKGSILQKAVQYIQELKAQESTNIEKWTLEKLLTEQAIGELSGTNEKLRAELARAHQKIECYERACKAHGVEVDFSPANNTGNASSSSS